MGVSQASYIVTVTEELEVTLLSFSPTLANLLEYIGVRSADYTHAHTPNSYDPENPLAYFVDESMRGRYKGPFDSAGVPHDIYKGNLIVVPVNLCFWGLGQLDLYRSNGQQYHLDNFLLVVDWLTDNQLVDGDWLTPLPKPKFGLSEHVPSAMVQGLAISCLVRGYRLKDDARFIDAAKKALGVFNRDVRDGGVTTSHDGMKFYEEYPAYPPHHVLNGFIYSLWGLHDLARAGDEKAAQLYDNGVKTLESWLPRYDMGYWSLYHISDGMPNPATAHYHRLHIDQLDVMATLTGKSIYAEYRDRWRGYLESRWDMLRTLPAKLRWRLFYHPPAS